MRKRLEYLVLVGLSAGLSYWLFLLPRQHGGGPPAAEPPPRQVSLTVDPVVASTSEPAAAVAVETRPRPEAEAERSPPPPPPPEAGSPDGEEQGPPPSPAPPDAGRAKSAAAKAAAVKRQAEEEKTKDRASGVQAEDAATLRQEMTRIKSSGPLLEEAHSELSGRARRGFQTMFLCAARDQLAIARFFQEPIVLVPRAGLSPDRPVYYRLEPGPPARIVTRHEPPPLERFRQYRDLFAFSYESLPTPIRELRRRIFVRDDIYLFAALIPPHEWGLVIARRRAALAAHARALGIPPRKPEEVRLFTLRYVRLGGGAFDIRVKEILFADGSRWNIEDHNPKGRRP